MIIENCRLCPRDCGAERDSDMGKGYCGMPSEPVVARAALHFFEEPCISGKNGSGAVFFSGCSLGCVFCQNYEISAKRSGKKITVQRLAEIFRELEGKGAHNINLVNPTHYSSAIKAALDIYRPSVPVVYNTGGYEKAEVIRSLEGYVDIYLPDLKYISSERSAKYSAAGDYWGVAAPALREMHRQAGKPQFSGDGMLEKGMLVRHLILPQGTAEAIAVINWVRDNLPNAGLSLMSQYMPYGRAGEFKEINRRITAREYDKVLSAFDESGISFGYTQERSSSDEKYLPDFDFTGV